MTDVKISALPAVSSALGTDEYAVNQGGVTKKLTGDQFAAYLRANLGAATGTSLTLNGTGNAILLNTPDPAIKWGSGSTTFTLSYNDSVSAAVTYQLSRNNTGSDHIFANAGSAMFRLQNLGPSSYGARLGEAIAIPSGGTTGVGYKFSSTTNFGIFFGSGPPSLTAAKGSLYLRSDGTTTTDRAYIATDSAGAWTALVTAT